jgi:hypothetical protein
MSHALHDVMDFTPHREELAYATFRCPDMPVSAETSTNPRCDATICSRIRNRAELHT